jgi:TonB family protein
MRLFAICLVIGAVLPASAVPEPTPFPPPGTVRSYFISTPAPDYPRAARLKGQQGKGWFELVIDFSTGHVDRVTVLKSTGSKILDDSVVATFQQWRAKPRMIRRAVFPVEFHRT